MWLAVALRGDSGRTVSGVEIRVEDPDFCDVVDGQVVAQGAVSDGLRAGNVVDAERFGLVGGSRTNGPK